MFEPIGTVLPVTTYAAVCEACDWVSAPSPSNLTALTAFDRHVASPRHLRRTEALATVELGPEDDEYWRDYRNGEGE